MSEVITAETIKSALLSRPYLVSIQTTERDVKAAFFDIMAAYVNRILPFYNEEDYECYDVDEYNSGICDLTFARLCYNDVVKVGYAVGRSQHDNITQATNQDQRRTARIYRRMGVAKLERLRILNGMDENYTLLPILGEEI